MENEINLPADPKEANNDGDPIREAALPPEIVNPRGCGVPCIAAAAFFAMLAGSQAVAAPKLDFYRASKVMCSTEKAARDFADAKHDDVPDEIASDAAGRIAKAPVCGLHRGEIAEAEDSVKLVDGLAYHVTKWAFRDRRGTIDAYTAERSFAPLTASKGYDI